MAKGGIYVRGELEQLLQQNPQFTFTQAAEQLYLDIPYDQLSRILFYPGAIGTFDQLGEIFVKGAELGARDVIKAVILDIFRIYALADPQLRAKIAS